MGLLKLKESETGSMGEYWKITHMEINWHNRILNCHLGLYVSKNVADNGKLYLETAFFTYSGENFDYTSADDLVSKTYLKIKSPEDSWFHDAVDVFEEGQP